MKVTLFTLILAAAFLGASCTEKKKSPTTLRLERNVQEMQRGLASFEEQLKTENDVGKRHELNEQKELLKSRLDRAEVLLKKEAP